MSANTILTSTITGGDNNHTTTSEEANSLATDFVTQGVVGAITLNTGSGGTGSFCVNADVSPDMGVTIKAGQAYITATPSSQNSQVLRARAAADYTAYTISANASGSTKYDWIYLSVDATKANNPASDASDVTSIVTSRSSSNSTDNGSPPTYGLLLAIVTVANAASSITNSNITDKRFNTSIGAQNGSLIVTQQTTGSNAIIQAAGQDANINLNLVSKGTGVVTLNGQAVGAVLSTTSGSWSESTSYAAASSSLSLTAGTWVIIGNFTFVSSTAATGAAYLKIVNTTNSTDLSGESIGSIQNSASNNFTNLSAFAAVTITGTKSVNLQAKVDTGSGSHVAGAVSLIAIQLASLS